MAIIHDATLVPSKLELIEGWLPAEGPLERAAACRLDDPDGEVGIELFVARTGDGRLILVPMTYRAAPLEGAEKFLIGTMEHSVLGTRWTYDAVIDPVFVAVLARTIREGGQEAPEFVETPEGPQQREPMMSLHGTGTQPAGTTAEIIRVDGGEPAVVLTNVGELSVRRHLVDEPADTSLTLTATWADHPEPIVLAVLS